MDACGFAREPCIARPQPPHRSLCFNRFNRHNRREQQGRGFKAKLPLIRNKNRAVARRKREPCFRIRADVMPPEVVSRSLAGPRELSIGDPRSSWLNPDSSIKLSRIWKPPSWRLRGLATSRENRRRWCERGVRGAVDRAWRLSPLKKGGWPQRRKCCAADCSPLRFW